MRGNPLRQQTDQVRNALYESQLGIHTIKHFIEVKMTKLSNWFSPIFYKSKLNIHILSLSKIEMYETIIIEFCPHRTNKGMSLRLCNATIIQNTRICMSIRSATIIIKAYFSCYIVMISLDNMDFRDNPVF